MKAEGVDRPWNRPKVVFLLVWSLSALYLAAEASRDWIPHDEGTLAQTAERMLQGELPHRDFDDTYTGGLTAAHALAFRILGTSLLSLRLMLLVFALGFVAALYPIARRALSAWNAGLVTLFCVVWTLPNYFSGVPSWYNLFFATFGTLALLRYAETERLRWLFVAGLWGGASILTKAAAGLFTVAAAGLFLIYRDQLTLRPTPAGAPRRGRGAGLPDVLAALGLAAFLAALVLLVSRRPTAMDILHFLVPGFALAGVLVWQRFQLRNAARGASRHALLRSALVLLAGVSIPIAAFLTPYALSGSLSRVYEGVFVAPQQRFEFASLPLPSPITLWTASPLALLLGLALAGPRTRRTGGLSRASSMGFALMGAVIAAAWGHEAAVYRAVWDSVRALVPLVALAGCFLLVAETRAGAAPLARQQLFLVLAMAAMTSLVQFPFSAGIYFCYALPPAVLALAFVLARGRPASSGLAAGMLGFYAAFAVLWLNPASTYQLGFSHEPIRLDGKLEMPRGGLVVSALSARRYADLIARVQAHSKDGSYIYASPDSPEVYFLAARRNPTRTFFEIFDPDLQSDPSGHERRILDVLRQRQVDVVVLRRSAEFSPPLRQSLLRELLRRYPKRIDLPEFVVLWRERQAPPPARSRGQPPAL